MGYNRFKLEKSTQQSGWRVLTDTENLVVVKFEEHRFNETQKVTVLEDSIFADKDDCAQELARVMSEMGDYMFAHWYSIAMPTPVFEFREDDENDRLLLFRNKFPKLVVEIHDDCDVKQLSDALRAASEFVKRRRL